MKKHMLFTSLALFSGLALVFSARSPQRVQHEAALDLVEYIGEVERNVSASNPALHTASFDEGPAFMKAKGSLQAVLNRLGLIVRTKIYQLQQIIPGNQSAPVLGQPAPVGFMLWFAHLGWYP